MRTFGLSNWDQKHGVKKDERPKSDLVRLPFLRLQKGNNILRIITDPYSYWQIKFDDKKSKFGERVYCSDKITSKETYNECPTVQAGYSPKARYMVGVIDRAEQDDEKKIKIYDMSVLVYEQLQALKDDPVYGSADTFDINVRFNPEAAAATGFYSVMPRPPAPLSESDISLISNVTQDVIAQNLLRLTAAPSADKVREKLVQLGWDGTKAERKVQNKKPTDSKELVEDYSFEFDKNA